MYHLYINTPDGTVANCKPSQLVRAAIMAPSEYRRIKAHLCWKKMQNWEAEQRNDRITKFKECSRNIVKTWRNTLVNKQLEREEKRRKRLESMENHKNALYEKSCIEKENERRKKLEEVRTYFLHEREDIKAINSAYLHSQVLLERQEQLKFKEQMMAKEQRMKEEYDNHVKKDVECFQQKQRDAKKDERKEKLKRRKELIEQLTTEKEIYEGEFTKEKDMERQDLLLMQEELKLIEENIRQEAARKKAMCREDVMESRQYAEEKTKLQKLVDEDQDKAIAIYLGYKRRIDCLIKKEKDRERKEREDRQEAIRKKILDSIGEAQSRLQKTEDHAIRQKEIRAGEAEKQRVEKIERLRRQRQENRLLVLREKQLKEEQKKELNLWEQALAYKRREVDKIRELKNKQDEWETKMETRKGYNAQIREKRQKIEAEKEEALREVCRILYDDSIVHEAFFKYAKEYLEKVRENGANDFPIVKEIENYRKRHGFCFVEKQNRRKKADGERWKGDGDAAPDRQGLKTALTVWQPERLCPLQCGPGKVPKDNVCVSPKASLNLPRIRSSDICGQIKRDIVLRELAEKGIR